MSNDSLLATEESIPRKTSVFPMIWARSPNEPCTFSCNLCFPHQSFCAFYVFPSAIPCFPECLSLYLSPTHILLLKFSSGPTSSVQRECPFAVIPFHGMFLSSLYHHGILVRSQVNSSFKVLKRKICLSSFSKIKYNWNKIHCVPDLDFPSSPERVQKA